MDAVAENEDRVWVDSAGTADTARADTADPDPAVLIVDDDADTRAVIASMLERDGLVALQAGDGETALRMIAETDVDAVILDVVMPDQSGYEICQRLREDTRARHLPVIMLTALSSLHAEVSGILSGADAYLVKPVRRKDLMDRVREML
jgi:DNA-binding response OmpR family regulator